MQAEPDLTGFDRDRSETAREMFRASGYAALYALLLSSTLLTCCIRRGQAAPTRPRTMSKDQDPSMAGGVRPADPQRAAPSRFLLHCADRGVAASSGGAWVALEVETVISAAEPGQYSLTGALWKNNTLVTDRPSKDASLPSASSAFLMLSATPSTVSLRFSGEDIRASGIDGPYTARLTLLDSRGLVAHQDACTTGPYRHTQFAEAPTRIIDVVEQATGPEGGPHEGITVHATLDVTRSQTFTIEATLVGMGKVIATAGRRIKRPIGTHVVSLLIPGAAIRRSGVNGPYTLTVVVEDDTATQISRIDLQSEEYDYRSFGNQPGAP